MLIWSTLDRVSLLRDGRIRRVSPVAVRSGEGLLSDYTAGIQPAQRELVFMLHSCRSRVLRIVASGDSLR
jgi:hypothetical protein